MSKQHSPKRIVKFLFDLWKSSPILSWSMIVFRIIFTILTTTIAPILVSQLFTSIANGSANIADSLKLLIGYGVILLAGNIISMITIVMSYSFETNAQSIVYIKVFKHLSQKSLNFHANKMSGGIVSDTNRLSGSIERFWDTLVFMAVPIITTIVSVCIALSFILWQFSLALAVLSITIIIVIVKAQTSIIPISRQVAEKSSAMTAHFADAISNIAAVKAFAKEKSELNKYQKLINKWRQSQTQEMKKVITITNSFGIMMIVMNLCAFSAAILATQYHIVNIGSIYLVINYTLAIVAQLWSVSNATRNYIRIIGDAGPMINTLDEEIDLTDPVSPLPFKVSAGKIEFKNVTFTHNEKDQSLFDDFSLIVNPGEQVGIVGRSGSGKTSLTRLLLRFSDINGGQILIDDQDIAQITQDDLHKSIAYVPQEPMLFHRSLRENIAYGKPNASDSEIEKVAKQANALDFIKDLPKGLDTTVGERGVKLSGGQRQRVAIARAILKDAPILVLDEATSALDSENEKLIQDALWKLMQDRTCIVIAHRLSTIAKLDRIVVLDNGKIIEQGSHNELLAKNGVYAKLWSHQSGGFIK